MKKGIIIFKEKKAGTRIPPEHYTYEGKLRISPSYVVVVESGMNIYHPWSEIKEIQVYEEDGL